MSQVVPGPERSVSRRQSDRRETAPRQPGGPASSPPQPAQTPPLRLPPPGPAACSPRVVLCSPDGRAREDIPPGRAHRAASPRGGPFRGPRRRGQRVRGAGSGLGGGAGGAGAGIPRGQREQRGRRRAWRGKSPRSASEMHQQVQRPELCRALSGRRVNGIYP